MRGEIWFNGQDSNDYGIIMGVGSYAAIISPPPAKEYVTSESRLEDGKRYLSEYARLNERTLTLTLYIKANSRFNLYRRLTRFVSDILSKGNVDITTRYQQNVVYHCVYKQITQLTEFNGRVGKFMLQLVEPDPSNRF